MIDLVLVNPNLGKPMGEFMAIEPPIWCATFAALARDDGYSVAIVDAELECLSVEATVKRVAKYNPRTAAVIAMGANPSASSTPKMGVSTQIIEQLNRIGIQSAVGGLHAQALPRETLDETGAKLLFMLPSLPYLGDLRMAAWDLLDMKRYRAHNWHCFQNLNERRNYAVIYTSYGCAFHCLYCNIHSLYGGKAGIAYRPIENVIQEIDYLVQNYGIKNLKIADELFAINESRLNSLLDLLIVRDYKLNIWAYARVDTVSSTMLDKMKRAGVNWLCYGFESANDDVRKAVDKKYSIAKMWEAVTMTREAGINIIGNFIFGLPDDNMDTLQATLDLAQMFNCEYVNFYCAMAYPGSKLYDDVRSGQSGLPVKWEDYSQFSPNMKPLPTKYLTSEQVLEFRDKAFITYFTNNDYLNMIERKFGKGVVEHINKMLKQSPRGI